MYKKIASLAGVLAMTPLAAEAAAPAAQALPPAQSYADLLKPVANAAVLLRADDAAQLEKEKARLQLAQYYGGYYYYPYYHHHHHHHNYWRRRWWHHHHHHHHRRWYYED